MKKTKSILIQPLRSGTTITLCSAALLSSALGATQEMVTYIKPVYSSQMKDAYGGTAQTLSKIKVSFELFNQGLRNSKISFQAQIAFPQEIDRITDNAFIDPGNSLIKNGLLRDNLQNLTNTQQFQGLDHIAYFDVINIGGGWAPFPGNKDWGVSFHGGAGNTVFRHEMGHAHGAPHSAGFQTSEGNTIMNGNSIPYFSSPNLFLNGVQLGDSTHDNVTTMKSKRAISAQRAKLNPDANLYKTWNVVSKNSGKAIDVNRRSNSAGAKIQQWAVNFTSAQSWHFNNFGGGASTMERLNTGSSNRFLSLNGNANGTAVTQQPWAVGKKRFFIEEQGDGYQRIRRDDSSNAVIDVTASSLSNGTGLVQWPWNGGANQRWKFIQID